MYDCLQGKTPIPQTPLVSPFAMDKELEEEDLYALFGVDQTAELTEIQKV